SGSTAAVTTGSGTLTLGGSVTFSATNNASGASISGNLDLGGATRTFTIDDSSAAASDLTVSAAISNGTLTKDGAGTLSLSGINTYTGTTTINAGNLTLTGGSAISNSGAVTLTNAAGAILHVAQRETIGNLSGGGASGGNISISSGQTLTVNHPSADTFAGFISVSGGITKHGSSSLTLSNTNTYQGATTINAGTINLSGSNTASTTAINSGGTLIGTGSAGAVTVNSGGAIGAGSAALTAGTLTIGTLTLNGGSTYSWDLGNATGSIAGTDWDVLNVTGALTLNATAGNQITIALGGTAAPTTSKSWNIINYGSLPNTWDSSVFNITNNISGSSGTWSLTNNSTFIGLTYTLSSTSTWTGGAGNWSSGFSTTPANGNALVFSGAGGTATNDIASGNLTSLTTITINSTAGSYTLAANSGSSGFDAA
ncbi:MAG: beta strand repeat-containing protein, partial [Spartobacteria bacterium]